MKFESPGERLRTAGRLRLAAEVFIDNRFEHNAPRGTHDEVVPAPPGKSRWRWAPLYGTLRINKGNAGAT